MAWVTRSRPIFAEPPAESPSTMKISVFSAAACEQSASFPGRRSFFVGAFLFCIFSSFFFLRASARSITYSSKAVAFSTSEVSQWSKESLTACSTRRIAFVDVNLSFVCP